MSMQDVLTAMLGGDKVAPDGTLTGMVTGKKPEPSMLARLLATDPRTALAAANTAFGYANPLVGAGQTLYRAGNEAVKAYNDGSLGDYAGNVAHQATNALTGGQSDNIGRAILNLTNGHPTDSDYAGATARNDSTAAQFPDSSSAVGAAGVGVGMANPALGAGQLAGYLSGKAHDAWDWASNLSTPEGWVAPTPVTHQPMTQDAYLTDHLPLMVAGCPVLLGHEAARGYVDGIAGQML